MAKRPPSEVTPIIQNPNINSTIVSTDKMMVTFLISAIGSPCSCVS